MSHAPLGHSEDVSAEQRVLDLLHEHTDVCSGADTCLARHLIGPLTDENDRLRRALERIEAGHPISGLPWGQDRTGKPPEIIAREALNGIA